MPLPPGTYPAAFSSLNNSGEAAGTAPFCTPGQFTFFPAKTGIAGLNDSGAVVGTSGIGPPMLTFRGDSTGSILTGFYPVLPEEGNLGDDEPVGINQAGIIAGVFNVELSRSTGYIGVPSGLSSDTMPPTISLLGVDLVNTGVGPQEEAVFWQSIQ